jgi:hypothetical protein
LQKVPPGSRYKHSGRLGEIIGNLGPIERQCAMQALGQPIES